MYFSRAVSSVVSASRLRRTFWFALTAALAPHTSFATNYANVSGTTVGFASIHDGNGLWEQPTSVADTLIFTPSSYLARCPDAVICPFGGVQVDDNLQFTIDANPGGSLDILLFDESGTATLTSSGGNIFAGVDALITVVSILRLDGTAINPITVQGPNLSFTSGSTFTLPGAFGFSGSASVDLNAIIALAFPLETRSATTVMISLNNPLTAAASAPASSLIQKDQFRVTVVPGPGTVAVPEPATALLLCLGLVGLALRRTNGGDD